MEKIIPIKTVQDKVFRQYLEIINPIISLRGKELDVLSQLLYQNFKLKHIDEEHRWTIIMSYDIRKQMQDTLAISGASFDNILSSLRKKNILKNNKVSKNFLIYPDKNIKLTFNFTIE